MLEDPGLPGALNLLEPLAPLGALIVPDLQVTYIRPNSLVAQRALEADFGALCGIFAAQSLKIPCLLVPFSFSLEVMCPFRDPELKKTKTTVKPLM